MPFGRLASSALILTALGACSAPTPAPIQQIAAIYTQAHQTAAIDAIYTEAHATAFASIATVPPSATSTGSPLATASPSATPTLVLLPQAWSGVDKRAECALAPVLLLIEEVDSESFSGRMFWQGNSRCAPFPAITKISGQYVRDFGDAGEQAKWGNHPDYKKGERGGTWLKWTETELVAGGWGAQPQTLGGWYYGHVRADGTMTVIFYSGGDLSRLSNDTWEFKQK